MEVTTLLTIIVAGSTIVYTLVTVFLWRTTVKQAEIARYSALTSLWIELNRFLDDPKNESSPQHAFMTEFSGLLAAFIIENLMADVKRRGDRTGNEFLGKVNALAQKHAIDPKTISWFPAVYKKHL